MLNSTFTHLSISTLHKKFFKSSELKTTFPNNIEGTVRKKTSNSTRKNTPVGLIAILGGS
jgi:hypothetical protein